MLIAVAMVTILFTVHRFFSARVYSVYEIHGSSANMLDSVYEIHGSSANMLDSVYETNGSSANMLDSVYETHGSSANMLDSVYETHGSSANMLDSVYETHGSSANMLDKMESLLLSCKAYAQKNLLVLECTNFKVSANTSWKIVIGFLYGSSFFHVPSDQQYKHNTRWWVKVKEWQPNV